MADAVRLTMSELLARTRRLIGDPASATQAFEDGDVQDQLDQYKHVVRYALLRPGPTLLPGGLYDYLDYYAGTSHWEQGEVLTWADYSVLTPVAADRISGHWTLDNSKGPMGVYPPVRITGTFYDVWAAAADLLEQWAALASATSYDFTSDGQSFHRSQIVTAKLALAKQYRRKALAGTVQARRSDLAGGGTPFTIASGGPGDVA